MSRLARPLGARSCAVSRGERGIRAVIAVFLAAFALNALDTPWCAIPAGVCATLLAIGAITGWCPTDLFARTSSETDVNALGYPEARQPLTVDR
ncbi:DUF2892 domain-containing protein [Agromyces aurantiacus]|uniref:DUF2892 domain-containing protein n=1 Tax=Agromyces aurantiacus TaxID=165814 RepID=A0ABV9R723_9MICO|nr:DUF2892 domain-containing protein [Agromyces aurantiacus]MBM7503974.1 hypothetical protein [Agromyces aurantiacus]